MHDEKRRRASNQPTLSSIQSLPLYRWLFYRTENITFIICIPRKTNIASYSIDDFNLHVGN